MSSHQNENEKSKHNLQDKKNETSEKSSIKLIQGFRFSSSLEVVHKFRFCVSGLVKQLVQRKLN